jgi:3-deoxy-manno-octulosonate cytidylyltransferase (CMP-KDO synthetase)
VPPVAFPDPFERTSQPPRVVAVIPARYDSTRLPGKPLADIAGHPMIEHVYRRAAEARGVDAVVVATDDDRIASAVQRFGGVARLTSAAHRTGTDRIAEIAHELRCDIMVNVQGDLPLVEPGMIQQVVEALTSDQAVRMSTVCRRIDDPEDYANPNVVKVVVDRDGNALYFSRASIPYFRQGPPEGGRYGFDGSPEGGPRILDRRAGRLLRSGPAGALKHIGMYGYRRDFLLEFAALPQTPLEQAESLEQLRALEHGIRIRTVETQYDSIEVDTPEDLERVRRLMTAPALAANVAKAVR